MSSEDGKGRETVNNLEFVVVILVLLVIGV